jgi:thiosulfate reductase cytochrome b subunit
MQTRKLSNQPSFRLILAGLLLVGAAALAVTQIALARTPATPVEQISPLHPTFMLLDEAGLNVLETGGTVSTMQTCGQCHDTDFIAGHSFHADAGLEDFTTAGQIEGLQPWDSSPGLYGKWDPLTYRYLSIAGDSVIDLTTPSWIMFYGARHVGGGPAEYTPDGDLLTNLTANTADLDTQIVDPQTGNLEAWDWQESGVVEMNCFLCHTPAPDNQARIQALQAGEFRWANTATLLGSGIVEENQGGYSWNAAAFEEDGKLLQEFVTIQDPTNANCGQCHGLVHAGSEPLVATGCAAPEDWRTFTTGQIISGQRLDDSGMNLQNKDSLSRTWDVHAERQVDCTDCHYALNNPVYYQESAETRPDYLTFDPRRLEMGEYLYQPIHQFARGDSAQSSVAPETQDTMRRCDGCHNLVTTHTWLPYKDRHMTAVSCETCHVPQMYSGAIESRDWTVLSLDGNPTSECRGVEGSADTLSSLVTGYEPAWLPRAESGGGTSLAPFNLITTWYWVYGEPARPAPLANLQAAWSDGNNYRADVLAAFDANADGKLDASELVLDTAEKQALIAGNLAEGGLESPRIMGEVQPYSINHNIASGDWVIRDCRTCHSQDSRVTQPIQLAAYTPAGVMPELSQAGSVRLDGNLYLDESGALIYQPTTESADLYVLGHDNVNWIDIAGGLIFLGVLLGVTAHGGMRYRSKRNLSARHTQIIRVYMYERYERLWHWLQTFTIVGLLFTGLIIHRPDTFGIFSFNGVVIVHNVLAAILAVNAALSLLYHLASGQIRQYIPRPAGFFDQAIEQAIFYVRGIFKGEPHPFEKKPEKKLNPLQQATYIGLLNVLLPLQGLTGILMWGAQRWPDLSSRLGGLPFLAPLHTIVAWLFAAFIVTHVYLTTTGHKPLTDIQAMITGWEDVEVHEINIQTASEAPQPGAQTNLPDSEAEVA